MLLNPAFRWVKFRLPDCANGGVLAVRKALARNSSRTVNKRKALEHSGIKFHVMRTTCLLLPAAKRSIDDRQQPSNPVRQAGCRPLEDWEDMSSERMSHASVHSSGFHTLQTRPRGHEFALQSVNATTPDGSLHYVEILRCATSIESNAVNTHVVGSRIY